MLKILKPSDFSILRLRDIELHQGSGFCLKIDSLDFFAGRIYALTGPNGSGKSTLLHMLGFLTSPEHGCIEYAGQAVSFKGSQLNKLRREITLVEQFPYLFDADVYSNIATGLRLRGIRKAEQEILVSESLSAVGLAGYEKCASRQLSGGELRRVALARAIAIKPKVLLLDEINANIDSDSQQIINELLVSLNQQKMTIILATHDQRSIETISADVICLKHGYIEAKLPVGSEGKFIPCGIL